ncbi:MAG: type I methionyl aminopeptidase [Patescibacteria group bacterium]
MAVRLKSEAEINKLRRGGQKLAQIISDLAKEVRSGLVTAELDQLAREKIEQVGATPSFLNYRPAGVPKSAGGFPAALCVSVNDEVVHGRPGSKRLTTGDLVSLDLGLVSEGLFTDMAITLAVGKVTAEAEKLLAVTAEALDRGIAAARAGERLGDIGWAIESFVAKSGFGLVKDFGGHGVGFKVHEAPEVPNHGQPDTGLELVPGLVIAIEPMVTSRHGAVVVDADGYTVRTKDGGLAAHFEHTVLITRSGPEILTKLIS